MLQIQQLTKRYGEKTAVDALTLTIRPGEIFGFIGPNRCGQDHYPEMLLRHPPAGQRRGAGGRHLGAGGLA